MKGLLLPWLVGNSPQGPYQMTSKLALSKQLGLFPSFTKSDKSNLMCQTCTRAISPLSLYQMEGPKLPSHNDSTQHPPQNTLYGSILIDHTQSLTNVPYHLAPH